MAVRGKGTYCTSVAKLQCVPCIATTNYGIHKMVSRGYSSQYQGQLILRHRSRTAQHSTLQHGATTVVPSSPSPEIETPRTLRAQHFSSNPSGTTRALLSDLPLSLQFFLFPPDGYRCRCLPRLANSLSWRPSVVSVFVDLLAR